MSARIAYTLVFLLVHLPFFPHHDRFSISCSTSTSTTAESNFFRLYAAQNIICSGPRYQRQEKHPRQYLGHFSYFMPIAHFASQNQAAARQSTDTEGRENAHAVAAELALAPFSLHSTHAPAWHDVSSRSQGNGLSACALQTTFHSQRIYGDNDSYPPTSVPRPPENSHASCPHYGAANKVVPVRRAHLRSSLSMVRKMSISPSTVPIVDANIVRKNTLIGCPPRHGSRLVSDGCATCRGCTGRLLPT